MEGDRETPDAPAAARYPNTDRVPVGYHAAAGVYVAFCLWFAAYRPDAYRDAMQEDRLVEWASVLVFAAAGVLFLGVLPGGLLELAERSAAGLFQIPAGLTRLFP